MNEGDSNSCRYTEKDPWMEALYDEYLSLLGADNTRPTATNAEGNRVLSYTQFVNNYLESRVHIPLAAPGMLL